jgi:hypothetical protein
MLNPSTQVLSRLMALLEGDLIGDSASNPSFGGVEMLVLGIMVIG